MLLLNYDLGDLTRLRLADGPDPMWETVLSLHLLQNREEAVRFDPWRRAVHRALAKEQLLPLVRTLKRLAPWAAYFPDFLTPGAGGDCLDTSIERVLRTPRRRLRADFTRLYAHATPCAASRRLADGEPGALRRLGEALRRYHAVAVAPYATAVHRAVTTDRAIRAEASLRHGPMGLLTSYGATTHDLGTTEVPYPLDRGLALRGRGLTIVPSFFCVRYPVTLADAALPPVLVQPLTPAPGWLAHSQAATPQDAARLPVGQLIGPARALALEALDHPLTTTGLAHHLDLALSSASRHASVLREAGLITSERRANEVRHRRTALGDALLSGAMGR
ncbi:ArsR/SmtB family transcription factor [Streptomyces sp. NPDC050418]|uniref:ArsR/SmtB family transcription factor n=1 Tax=Streptomyces sp. NPDC050418 TaxID=3365612 RepID=UPI00379FD3E8